MINKVIEEALTNLIRRVEKLEERNTVSQKKGQSRGLATESQLNFIRGLRGEIWEGMTMSEAGIEIERMKNIKNNVQKIPPIEIPAEKLTKKQLKEMENLGKKYDGEALI